LIGGYLRKNSYKLALLLAAASFATACGGGGVSTPQMAASNAAATPSANATGTSGSSTTSSTPAPTPSPAPSPTPAPAPDPTTLVPPAGATTVTLDQASNWQSCDVCAGTGGNGPSATHSMTQGIVSPSLDGASTQFWVGGSTPYSDVLWHKTVLDSTKAALSRNVHFFVYDLYFYTDNGAAAQSIEWDVNQFLDGRSYIFGSQCSYRSKGTWDIWDNANSHWISTGVSCGGLQSNTWNHVTLEFERTTDNRLHYIAMTLNGTRHYLNTYYDSTATTWNGVTVNYQMDGDYKQTNYSTWVDKMTLTYW
jgi:hypothetical protein